MKGATATAEIRGKLRLLNLVVSFVIFTLLFVIVRYLYDPSRQLFSFLPDASFAAIVLFAVFLAVIGFYLSRVLSKQIITDIENYRDRLNNILTLTRDLREEIYSDLILEKIMNCSLVVTRSEAGSLLLAVDGSLVFKTVKGMPSQDLQGKTVTNGVGIAGWVSEHGEPLLIGDIGKERRYDARVDEFPGYRARSMLCMPLKTKSTTIGVLELLSEKPGFFTEGHLDVIRYLADQAAISIERAQFYDDQRNYEIHLTDILLATIDRILPVKQGHPRRVARYANILAKALDMPEERKRRLYFASLLHDIGFLKIEPGRDNEREAFLTHPTIGYEMLNSINFYRDIAPHVLHHHERYDGNGYPKKLKSDDIPLESRIIAIAEAFDSMVSPSSYRIPLTFSSAVDELEKNKGSQFDAGLVDLFVANISEPTD